MRTEYVRNADVNANIRDGQKENAFTADMNARTKILLTINARCADSSARTRLMKTAFVRFAEHTVNIWNGKTENAKNAKWSATTEITARQQESKHDFTKGVCVCGLTPPFVYGDLPASILNECFNQGVVRTYQYSTKKYADGNTPITKNFDIYLPYGYDRNNKYDVILMMHGDGGKYNDWTTNSLTIGSLMTVPKNIYDNVIDQGLCKPFILVSVPTLYQTENGETDSGYKQMAPEIRNDLLPFIVKNFGTYAEDSSLAAISAAREHFAIGGVDNGATYAYYCGMKENFDLFANFVCFSGCATPEEYVKNIEKGNNAKLPVKTYVNGAGSNDPARFRCLKGFDVITGSSDKFQESINSYYVEVNGGHNWASWATLTYDALLVLFQDSVFQ